MIPILTQAWLECTPEDEETSILAHEENLNCMHLILKVCWTLFSLLEKEGFDYDSYHDRLWKYFLVYFPFPSIPPQKRVIAYM